VLVPQENDKDLKEIPAKILETVKVGLVEHMDEVLKEALVLDDPQSFLQDGQDKREGEKDGTRLYPEENSSTMVTH
jgi:predicted ATP-dependent protease